MPLKSETADVQAAIKEINGLVEDVVIDVSLSASVELFRETPQVSTFTASNWAGPDIGKADAEVRSVKKGRLNREAKAAALLKYRLSQGKTFIQNSVKHIEELNARGSAKLGKPAAFAQRAVGKAVRQTLRRLRKRSRAWVHPVNVAAVVNMEGEAPPWGPLSRKSAEPGGTRVGLNSPTLEHESPP